MISTDRGLLEAGSSVLLRQGKLLETYQSIYIIVFAKKSFPKSLESGNIFVLSTQSVNRFFYIWDAFRLGYKILQTKNITDVSCQDPFETGLVGFLLKKFFKFNLELQIHTDLGSSYFFKHNVLNKVRFFIAQLILSKADRVRVVSQRIFDYVGRLVAKDKIYIKPITVDIDKIINQPITVDLHQKYPQFKKIILMVSRLESEKNIQLAFRALAKIKDESIGLVLVGSGREKNNLERLAKKLGVKVVFKGWVSDPISYYKTADLFLNTSWYEGYGMALVEADTAGLPIVSTDVGVAPELGAELVGFDVPDIANKIKTILQI